VLRAVLEVTGGILPINGMYSIQTSGERGKAEYGLWAEAGQQDIGWLDAVTTTHMSRVLS
jgi:hypothetical protein